MVNVVDAYVKAAEAHLGQFHQRRGEVLVADVARQPRRAGTERGGLGDHRVQLGLAAAVQDHAGAVRREQACGGAADARGGAGDEGDLARQLLVHP